MPILILARLSIDVKSIALRVMTSGMLIIIKAKEVEK